MVSTQTMVVTASVASLATGLIAYAFYFDHKRRSQPEFRRNLRREQRKTARMAEVYAAAEEGKHLEQIKKLVQDAIAAGFPTTTEEKEQYFLEQVSLGEQLSQDPKRVVDSALAFYKGLKVYPNPSDLVAIYDKTVSKPVLDIIAIMCACDSTLDLGPALSGSTAEMPPTVGLD